MTYTVHHKVTPAETGTYPTYAGRVTLCTGTAPEDKTI